MTKLGMNVLVVGCLLALAQQPAQAEDFSKLGAKAPLDGIQQERTLDAIQRLNVERKLLLAKQKALGAPVRAKRVSPLRIGSTRKRIRSSIRNASQRVVLQQRAKLVSQRPAIQKVVARSARMELTKRLVKNKSPKGMLGNSFDRNILSKDGEVNSKKVLVGVVTQGPKSDVVKKHSDSQLAAKLYNDDAKTKSSRKDAAAASAANAHHQPPSPHQTHNTQAPSPSQGLR